MIRETFAIDVRLLGRPIRPFHLALLISTGTVAVADLAFSGIVLDGRMADAVGVVAAAAALLLTAGWLWNRTVAAEWGLLLAAGAWASRAAFAALTGAGWPAVILSLAWMVGAGGAYLLERYDRNRQ